MSMADFSNNIFDSFKDKLDKAVSNIEGIVEKPVKVPTKLCRSQRAELFKELYYYYEKSYKKNTWNDYVKWLGEKRLKHSPERIEQYKKTKGFRKQIEISSFCAFWFNFLKTEDLHYLVSVAKDMTNRGKNFNQWLFWSIKRESVL